MITCNDIFKLYRCPLPETDIHEAFRKVPTDSRDESRYNRTPLHLACEFADIEAVNILLERKAEVDAKDDKGLTPLCVLNLLPSSDSLDEHVVSLIAEQLLKQGAQVSSSGKHTTALLEAVRNHHHELVAALIHTGVCLDSTDKEGENALHIASREAGNAAAGIRQMEQRIANFDTQWYSHKEMERMLRELEERREEEMNCNKTAKRLLESGQFDPEDKNNNGKTAFDIAMAYGAKWVGALLSGQDPETDELAVRTGGQDIFQALYYKDMKALEALLCGGIELQTLCTHQEIPDFYDKSPLACALSGDNIEAAERMLRAGADPNYKLPEERTAFAVWTGKNRETENKLCLPMLQQMSHHGWQPEQAVDKEGNTALSFACRYANKEPGRTAIHYLVSIGADVNAVNSQGQSPLMNLYGGRFWDGKIPPFPGLPRSYPYARRTCGQEDAEILEILLKAGADIHTTDTWGNTILHYIAGSACPTASKKAAEILFDFGRPAIETVNNEGKTAIDIATEKNDETLVKFLLKHL